MSRRAPALVAAVALLAAACTSGADGGPGAASTAPAGAATSVAPVSAARFTALHTAVGYGLLRVMTLEERPDQRDIVIYRALPNELPRVAGVITTVEQTPLSHVNLRAVQDDVPNAVVPDLLDDPAVTALVGRYVRYAVTDDAVTIEAATQAEVEAHHAAARPTEAQVPERDLSVRAVTALTDVGFEDWAAFGVKAANLATLATFGLPGVDVPTGFAVPFWFYDQFMQANGLYDRVSALLADEAFRSDPSVQDAELADLRRAIEDAPVPAWMEAALDEVAGRFPAGTPIRCRSSTNNEDLPDFSGAGLYDSKTQHPDEGPLSKCIKQVYASVWNLRAFLAREFYRIDHLVTAMGVVLAPAFTDEKANGVAVSIDPVYATPGAYYVNTQLGEDLVTNPDGLSVPEAVLLYADGSVGVASHSNLVEPGERLLTDDLAATLRSALGLIHERFEALYRPAPGEAFAMEVEFKVTAAGRLAIKQARRWVFT